MESRTVTKWFQGHPRTRSRKHPNKVVTSKYSFVTFIPLNILHQLSKPSTFFFFVTAALLFVPAISPFSPWSYFIAFLIVIGVSVVKDALEDYNRHINDRKINDKKCRVIEMKAGRDSLVEKKVMDIDKGDWLYLARDEEVPADVILVRGMILCPVGSGSDPEKSGSPSASERRCIGHCFIDTRNLDGESNLKKRSTMSGLIFGPCRASPVYGDDRPSTRPCQCIARAQNSITGTRLEDTGDSFSDFRCHVDTAVGSCVASERNALLRGSIVKNVDYAVCLVVAVGAETKQWIGTSRTRKKKSVFEQRMDFLLFLVAILYAAILIATTAFGAYKIFTDRSTQYILGGKSWLDVIRLFFSNYVIYSYLVPLSLYVTIEVARFFHAQYVSYDQQMCVGGTKSFCNNSNVIEDLGMVEYVLTDKTGTITKNSMTLRAMHLAGEQHIVDVDEIFERLNNPAQTWASSGVLAIREDDETFDKGKTDNEVECKTVKGDVMGNRDDENNRDAITNNNVTGNKGTINKAINGTNSKAINEPINGTINEPINGTNSEAINEAINGTNSKATNEPINKTINEPINETTNEPTNETNNSNETNRSNELAMDKLSLLLMNILVCNSVEVLNGEYQGVSQDELCFLKAMRKHGYQLLEREDNFVLLSVKGRKEKIRVLYTLEFSSKRQIMSVLVERSNRYFLFTKGSDQRLLNDGEKEIMEIVNNAGDYRSLVMRCREMTRAEAESLRKTEDKEMLRAAHRASEYLGSTFIEDELQEQVAETMDALHRAGIRIWMITGDKQETAICCARNAGIVGTLPSLVMEGCEVVEMLEEELRAGRSGDGASESRDERTARLFEAESLVIYRATPSQKGQITALLASEKKHVLAIGDGNNDVAMLRGAHVGVGILGKEGTQASFAADFAIPKFMLLRNLILVHGRYNLIRYSKISLNAFYKNILFIFVQFFYNFANCASGFPIYNEFFMNYYNLFFTSLIPFSIALFDRDVPQRSALSSPESYCLARAHFSRRLMCANVAFGVFQATLIYFVFYSIIGLDICSIDGIPGAYGALSTFFSIAVFLATILRQYRQISFVVKYSNIALLLSVAFMVVLLFGLQDILVSSNSAIYMIMRMPVAYLVMAAVGGLIFMSEAFFDVLHEGLINKAGYEPS